MLARPARSPRRSRHAARATARRRQTLAQYQGTAGDLDGARASALKAVSYQPTYPPALNVLGIVATQKHQNAQAEAWIERSLAAEPGQRSEARLLAELKKGCTALRLTAHAKGVQLNCPH